MGPARGEAAGKLPAGSYRLQITQGRAVDSYTLTIGEETTGLAPQQGRFSTSSSQIVYRVAGGRRTCPASLGRCELPRASPRPALPPGESFFFPIPHWPSSPPARPGPYSQSWFNSDGRRYAAPAFSALRPWSCRPLSRSRVLPGADRSRWGGESVSNLR